MGVRKGSETRIPEDPELHVSARYDKIRTVGDQQFVKVRVVVDGWLPDALSEKLQDAAHSCIDCNSNIAREKGLEQDG